MRSGHGVTLAREIVEERVPQRRRVAAPLQRARGRAVPSGNARSHRATFAHHELELPELVRLESARRLQPIAERQELERRHRFEDVDLRDEHLQDRQDPLQRVLRAVRFVGASSGITRSSSCSSSLNHSS